MEDYCGMKIAMSIFYQSLRKGKNSESHLQYGSIAKLRSALATGFYAAHELEVTKFEVMITNRRAPLTKNFSPTDPKFLMHLCWDLKNAWAE